MDKTYILASMLVLASGCSPPDARREAVGDTSRALTSSHTYNLGALAHPGSCMDVASAGTADGTHIQEWTCNGTGAQSFQLQAIDSTWYKIVTTASGKCVDAAANGTADGTNVRLWTCNGTGAQAWQSVASGSFFKIVGQTSNKCIDVQDGAPTDGTNIQLWSYNTTPDATYTFAISSTITADYSEPRRGTRPCCQGPCHSPRPVGSRGRARLERRAVNCRPADRSSTVALVSFSCMILQPFPTSRRPNHAKIELENGADSVGRLGGRHAYHLLHGQAPIDVTTTPPTQPIGQHHIWIGDGRLNAVQPAANSCGEPRLFSPRAVTCRIGAGCVAYWRQMRSTEVVRHANLLKWLRPRGRR